ncbi:MULTISPECIES: O-antigen ligase family protein [unclassified Novosphingobium]|uniref:O-antigen ligase family protein n=1 Tax=unclassified Novosphingobium TaxID=2644732 RepID=UPI00149493E6|nr:MULTISPECIES: O-antigen ligase family protein [unclassified Novosphingobium]MBB3359954.1 O-antigen ligase [Novosphingobium sp. BK256]MBB3376313.1 O-antigen ligase [Novosphingobium sp. BK280]MBB3380806.1 O-antigen ligase [Novosphingobium sp. BK258]MBB3422378.1 O-antigen ligase [Novosphingobium sp. BK267]MBB3451157.1 O-antigen ligase [Novosphingobium sp. BK352]
MADFIQKIEQGKATAYSAVRPGGTKAIGERLSLTFFCAALLLGGAGTAYPLIWWGILLMAIAVIGLNLARHPSARLPGVAKGGLALVAAYWLLLAGQVAPLPHDLWASLPGHHLAAEVATTAGVDPWRSWSLAPGRSLQNLLDVLAPLAALLLLATASTRHRIVVLRLLVAVALCNALLGIAQFGAGADAAPIIFQTTHRGVAVGLFVNRNHTAVFLMVGMLLSVLPGVVRLAGRDEGGAVQAVRAVIVSVLALSVLATLSRSGVFLLPVALVAAALLARPRRLRLHWMIIAGLGCVIAMALIVQTAPVQELAARYASAADDARFDYWRNTWLAVRDSFPLGTGFGSFQKVYQTFEPLNQLSPATVNKAHNDFLQLLLEGGVAGLALLAMAVGLIGFQVVLARRRAGDRFERRLPVAVAVSLGIIAGASSVDYPLYGAAMSTTAGALIGLLAPSPSRKRRSDITPRERWARIAGGGALICLTIWATMVCWSQHLLLTGNASLAARLQPLNAAAWSTLANERENAGDADGSLRAARHALALDLLDASALRAVGMARLQQGDQAGGAAVLMLGAQLGWRDAFTQIWLVQQSLAAGAYGFAVQRIDALLRTQTLFEQMIALLPPLMAEPSGRQALAEQMGYDPGWRISFFNTAARSQGYALSDLFALLAEMRKGPKPVRPDETALIRAVLGQQGHYGAAREVWLASGGHGNLADPGFETQTNFTTSTGPYVWQATQLPGTSVRSDRAGSPLSGRALAVASDGAAAGAVLTQTVALQPGRYRIGLTVLARNTAVANRIGLTLACLSDAVPERANLQAGTAPAASPATVVGLAWQQRSGGVLVGTGIAQVDAHCAGQRLALTVPVWDEGPYSVWVDDIILAAMK